MPTLDLLSAVFQSNEDCSVQASQYGVPSERTFRRLLKQVDGDQLKNVLVGRTQMQDTSALQVVHVDGKVVKNAQPAPVRCPVQQAETAVAEPREISPEWQKPKAYKAMMLVSFQTTKQRLVDEVTVPKDAYEEAAVASHLPKMVWPEYD
jgi:hypothetical protein